MAHQEDWLPAERLHRAAAEGNLDTARALIREGAPLNAFDAIGYAPLHHAAKNDRFEMVRLLLDAGAHIDAQAGAGAPLAVAASPRMAEFLRNFGADAGCRPSRTSADPR